MAGGMALTFHKRSNIVINSIMFIIVLFVMSLFGMFFWKAWHDLVPDILEDVNSTEAKAVVNEVDSRYPSVMDGIILLVFVGFWIVGAGSAYFSNDHPFLFGLMFILVVFVIIAGVMLGNFYEELFQDKDLADIADSFPITHWIMTHLLIIGIVISMSMAIFFFGRRS